MRASTVFCAGFLLLLLTQAAAAQETAKTIDDTLLRTLYEHQLRNPDDSYIPKRIEDERASIREFIEEEVQKTMTPLPEEAELDPTEIPGALERQRSVITALEDRLRERKVDLELLGAEEQRFYRGGPQAQTGSEAGADEFRTTKTYAELLAKKAVLEERIAVLEGLLPQQNERLEKLLREQRLIQFSFLITIGKYLLVIFVIWLLERFIRTSILSQIKQTDRRYTVTKIFTSVVYLFTIGWLLAILFARNPGIFTSFAIVGAGLAIALQDVVKDVVGWFVILQHRLYSIGDRITIGASTGEVIDINILRTKLLEVGIPPQSVLEHTGKILSVPNASVLTQPVTNHSSTSDFVNAELRVTVTYESNWRRAKQILEDIVKEETSQFTEREKSQQKHRTRMMYIIRQAMGPRVYTTIAADGVEFMLRFSVPLGGKWPVMTALSEKILERFDAEPDIELAYKTIRYYRGVEENG